MIDKRTELKGKDKFLADLSSFLEKHKYFLLIALAVIVVAIIVVAVIDSAVEKKVNVSAALIEQVQKDYDDWIVLDDEDSDKAQKKDDLLISLDSIISDYPSTYAEQRAYFLKANISFSEESWTDAASLFSTSAEVNRESYLAPVALMLSASSLENAADYQKAIERYRDICDKYDKIYPDVPHAMLSIARLYEQTGDIASATDSYNELLDKYPGSGWSSFARTRLINLD